MSQQTVDISQRDTRQRDLVPPEKLAVCHGLVIGVGAIGRQVALQLAAMGLSSMTLMDHDSVAVENLAPQGYWPEDMGRNKVDATAGLCASINPELKLAVFPQRFARSTSKMLACLQSDAAPTAVFACVDSISTRQIIYQSVRQRAAMFIDGRMSAEVIRVLAVGDPPADSHYPTTLFAPEQAHTGSCTAKSAIYTASIAAGLMLSQFTRWLRGLPVDRDITLNLLSAEMTSL